MGPGPNMGQMGPGPSLGSPGLGPNHSRPPTDPPVKKIHEGVESDRVLFAYGLGSQFTDPSIRGIRDQLCDMLQYFEVNVTHAAVKQGKGGGHFAFIECATKQDGLKAIESCRGIDFGGKPFQVKFKIEPHGQDGRNRGNPYGPSGARARPPIGFIQFSTSDKVLPPPVIREGRDPADEDYADEVFRHDPADEDDPADFVKIRKLKKLKKSKVRLRGARREASMLHKESNLSSLTLPPSWLVAAFG